jgi:N-terminal acetyltransferase B complex non-catalytic subunit
MKLFTLYYIIFQVIEFVQFKERLQHSNQYLMARVEAPILQLKQNADNIEEEEVFFFKKNCHFSM